MVGGRDDHWKEKNHGNVSAAKPQKLGGGNLYVAYVDGKTEDSLSHVRKMMEERATVQM